jgi:hypothetical protein
MADRVIIKTLIVNNLGKKGATMTTLFFLSGIAILFLLFVIYDYKTGFTKFTMNTGSKISEDTHTEMLNMSTNPLYSHLPSNIHYSENRSDNLDISRKMEL